MITRGTMLHSYTGSPTKLMALYRVEETEKRERIVVALTSLSQQHVDPWS